MRLNDSADLSTFQSAPNTPGDIDGMLACQTLEAMNANADLAIGIFDSGIGGLTVVRQIHRVLPHEDLTVLLTLAG